MKFVSSQKTLDDLQRVCWSPAQATSKLLATRGIKHGFSGVGVEHPDVAHHAKQVHGIVLAEAKTEFTGSESRLRPEADAIWTRESGVCVAVKTADCLPVLIASCDGDFVMAVHGGWRGVVAGILPEAVRAYLNSSTQLQSNSLMACIGPAISPEQFEVGPEVIGATQAESFGLDDFATGLTISKGVGDRWHFDLPMAAALQLMASGIPAQQIEVIGACTKTLAGQWHSYRREGKGCGSNWSWIEAKI